MTNASCGGNHAELVDFAHADEVSAVWDVEVCASVDFECAWKGSEGFLIDCERDLAPVDNHGDGSYVLSAVVSMGGGDWQLTSWSCCSTQRDQSAITSCNNDTGGWILGGSSNPWVC